MEPGVYRFGEYIFAVLRYKDLWKIPEEGWLISECPPNWAIAFHSPKFGRTKRGEWLFCNVIKRLPFLSLVMEKVPEEVVSSV
jgi:hypothetical protein